MKPSMAKPSHFHWTTSNKVTNHDNEQDSSSSSSKNPQSSTEIKNHQNPNRTKTDKLAAQRRKLQAIAVSRLRSVITALSRRQPHSPARVTGTLFGRRRGHVHFALQNTPTSEPSFLVELATPISNLVREMASGLIRIALECDKGEKAGVGKRLVEEVTWRAYCNGKRCGYGTRRECGEREWKVLKAVEMVSMGAGVLPGKGEKERDDDNDDDEVMYMRAKFERVVGDRDSEAFYMMNPDCNGAPELSVYLLRV